MQLTNPFVQLDQLPAKVIIPGYTARTIHTGTLSFVYWSVEAGAEMPQHNHLHQQVAHVLEGQFELTVNGETQVLEPGAVAVIPPYVSHGGRALTSCQLLDVFTPEREDYKF